MISLVTYYGVEHGVTLEYENSSANYGWGAEISPTWRFGHVSGFGPTIEFALVDLKSELESLRSDFDEGMRDE